MDYTVYIGTYTNAGGKGVYRADLDAAGKLALVDAAESVSPSYVIFSADRRFVYAANEAREVDGVPGGALTAFELRSDGSLKKLVTRPTGGSSPCHILEHFGYLYVANYGDGSITVYPLQKGVPGEAEFLHRHEGSGPDVRRQEGPHAHCVMAVPGTDAFCAIDLGIDQARFYRKDDKALTLVQALSLPGGAGPRHVVFSADGRFGWIVTELSNEVFAIRHDREWSVIGAYSTLPQGFTGLSNCAAIRLVNDGGVVAASNRGHDSVAVYDVDAATGLLKMKGIYPVGGKTPRDINFSPDGKWLLSANQDSDIVTVLSTENGYALVEGASLAVSRPTCILM